MEINGNYNNIGGGQVLRTALAMSLLSDMPFVIKEIRKTRPTPGLKRQHYSALQIIKELYDVDISDHEIGTTEIKFFPKSKRLKTRKIEYDIGTAGSIPLLLQSILLPLMFSDAKTITLKLKGGTDVTHSMPFDFLSFVLIPQIKFLTAKIDLKLIKRGFYPKGCGEIIIKIKPKYINNYQNFSEFQEYMISQNIAFDYENKGQLQNINGISIASKDLQVREVAERQERSARLLLNDTAKTNIRIEYADSASTGSIIVLYAKYTLDAKNHDISENHPIILGSSYLGEIDVNAKNVGRLASEHLIELIKSNACLDEHTADNLIPFLAIVGGKIKTYKITDHIIANVYVVNEFLKALKSKYYIKIDNNEKIISLDKYNS